MLRVRSQPFLPAVVANKCTDLRNDHCPPRVIRTNVLHCIYHNTLMPKSQLFLATIPSDQTIIYFLVYLCVCGNECFPRKNEIRISGAVRQKKCTFTIPYGFRFCQEIYGVSVTVSGNCTRISVPFPSALSSDSFAPCWDTICFTMARPSPVPPVALERPLSTR